jgi:gluconokinase
MLGSGFDARACALLAVPYPELAARVRAETHDEAVVTWLKESGHWPDEGSHEVWNGFMRSRGWRDDASALLARRREEAGLNPADAPTFFDLIEAEEGRAPATHRPWEPRDPRVILLLGVCGSGKTTIGEHLAGALGWRFADADAFHPPANRAKMSCGDPLTEEDRLPWLATLHDFLRDRVAEGQSLVLACSGLREAYRQRLFAAAPAAISAALLHGSRPVLLERLSARRGHYMPASLLDSQLATLELPDPAQVPTFDIDRDLATTLEAIVHTLRLPVTLPATLPA